MAKEIASRGGEPAGVPQQPRKLSPEEQEAEQASAEAVEAVQQEQAQQVSYKSVDQPHVSLNNGARLCLMGLGTWKCSDDQAGGRSVSGVPCSPPAQEPLDPFQTGRRMSRC